MQPAYHDGDRVLIRRVVTPQAGDVIVVERPGPLPPGSQGAVAVPGDGWCGPPVSSAARAAAVHERQWLIKRVAAAPGDPVPRRTVPALAHTADRRVPPGQLVLLGDNAAGSFDSRQLGSFPADRVLGVVILPRPRPPAGG
jgi:signal peptidase I